MCKELSSKDVQEILTNPTKETIGKIVAENISRKGIRNPMDFIQIVAKEPMFKKQNQLCVKMIESIGGHFNKEEIPPQVRKMANVMNISLNYNSDEANAFAGIWRSAQNKTHRQHVGAIARTF